MKKIVSFFTGTLLLIAVLPLPYDYYLFLRVFVFSSAAWHVYTWCKRDLDKMPEFTFLFSIIAILFNPFFPIHSTKSTWVVIDLISAGLFFFYASRTFEDVKKP